MKRLRLVGIASLLSMLVFAGVATAGTVRGTLKIDGNDAANVRIEIRYGEDKIKRAMTNKDGKFELNIPQRGICGLSVTHDEKSYGTSIEVKSTAVSYNLELLLGRDGNYRLLQR